MVDGWRVLQLAEVVCVAVLAGGFALIARHRLMPERERAESLSEDERKNEQEKDSLAYLIAQATVS